MSTKAMNEPKDVNAPKKNQSSYFIFSNERRPILQRENTDKSITQITKIINAEWKAMNPSAKSKYEQLADKDKKRYLEEQSVYQKTDNFKIHQQKLAEWQQTQKALGRSIEATEKDKVKAPKKVKQPDDEKKDNQMEVEPSPSSLPLPGECLIEATFDLDKDLVLLKQRYEDKYAELMDREIVKIECNDIDDEYDVKDNSIKVMQFNMLADGLCTAYTEKQTEKTFLNVDKECLQWTYRGIRLVEEILRFDPDILAIEECDQLPFLMKYLGPKGYDCYFQEKTPSPVRHTKKQIIEERKLEDGDVTMQNDGVALIFKTDKFEILNEGDVQYIDMTKNKEKVIGLAVPLKVKNNIDEEILFVVTHLKSTKTEEGEKVREKQINLLLKELIKNEKNLPIVLCCDLNANPIQNKKGYDSLCYNSITDKDNLGYESVYKLANGSEPEYTTYKLREHGTDKHTIDYIFVRGGKWNITALLNIPQDGMIPNWNYPSDHFSILVQLTWK